MRFLASFFALTLLTLTGCPSREPPICPPDGTGFANGTGLYCAYGVVIGGFRECPMGLPNRFNFPDGSFVCSDQPLGSSSAIPDDVCAAVSGCLSEDPCRDPSRFTEGAPCTDFGTCGVRGGCSPTSECVDGVVVVTRWRCDTGVPFGTDVRYPSDLLDAPWPTVMNVGVCDYVDYGSPCRVPCTAPPEARFSVRVEWDSTYCCTFFGPFENFEGCRCTDGFVECPWREAGGIWDNPRSYCEFCRGTPSGPRDAGTGPG